MLTVFMVIVLKYTMVESLKLADNTANDNMYMMIISHQIQSIMLAIVG